MRGIQSFRWACLCALVLLLGPSAGVVLAAQRPFVPPVQAEIARGFEAPSHQFAAGHRGVDYAVPDGTTVRASGAGTVEFAGPVAGSLYVTLRHADGVETTYSFLNRIDVRQGDQVAQGQSVGLSGEGHPGESHGLHFGAKLNGEYIDPLALLGDFDDITDLLSLTPEAVTGQVRSFTGHSFLPSAEPIGDSSPVTGTGNRGPPIPRTTGAGSVPHLGSGSDAAFAPAATLPVQIPEGPAPNGVGVQPGAGPAINLPVQPDAEFKAEPGSPRAPVAQVRAQQLLQVLAPAEDLPGARTGTMAEFWRTLTPEEKAAYIGDDLLEWSRKSWVSAHDRDAMNRILLEEKIAELKRYRNSWAGRAEVGLKNVETVGRLGWAPWTVRSEFDREAAIDRKIRSAEALWKQLTEVAKPKDNLLSREDVYLLDFDIDFANGDGKAVVALGDPGTAEHVGVVVPGINNALGTIDGTLRQAAILRSAAGEIDPKILSRTATIAWMGYDNPNGVEDAANRAEAQQGSPWLKSFVNGLRAGHTTSPKTPHITVFGHSYGSVVAGMAAFDGMKADDVVVYGSPGIGRSGVTAEDFKQRIWAAKTKGDIIWLAKIIPLMGSNPTSENFGARKVPVGPDQKGHSGYVERRSLAADNFARILLGRFEEVR
jgi:hypothetical protein